MNNKDLETLINLGVLGELINKCKELIQANGLLNGHRGYADDMLGDIGNEIYEEIEKMKNELL